MHQEELSTVANSTATITIPSQNIMSLHYKQFKSKINHKTNDILNNTSLKILPKKLHLKVNNILTFPNKKKNYITSKTEQNLISPKLHNNNNSSDKHRSPSFHNNNNNNNYNPIALLDYKLSAQIKEIEENKMYQQTKHLNLLYETYIKILTELINEITNNDTKNILNRIKNGFEMIYKELLLLNEENVNQYTHLNKAYQIKCAQLRNIQFHKSKSKQSYSHAKISHTFCDSRDINEFDKKLKTIEDSSKRFQTECDTLHNESQNENNTINISELDSIHFCDKVNMRKTSSNKEIPKLNFNFNFEANNSLIYFYNDDNTKKYMKKKNREQKSKSLYNDMKGNFKRTRTYEKTISKQTKHKQKKFSFNNQGINLNKIFAKQKVPQCTNKNKRKSNNDSKTYSLSQLSQMIFDTNK